MRAAPHRAMPAVTPEQVPVELKTAAAELERVLQQRGALWNRRTELQARLAVARRGRRHTDPVSPESQAAEDAVRSEFSGLIDELLASETAVETAVAAFRAAHDAFLESLIQLDPFEQLARLRTAAERELDKVQRRQGAESVGIPRHSQISLD